MQFQIEQKKAAAVLAQVSGVTEKRQTLPILSNVLLRLTGDQLTVVGTNLETEIQAATQAQNTEAGEITAPGRKLFDICRSLSEDARLTFKQVENRLTVQSGKSRFVLQTQTATEFPVFSESEWEQTITISAPHLKKLLDRTQFCVAQQDVRHYLNGLLFELAETYLRVIATDGHRLALSDIKQNTEGQKETSQFIIPKKAIQELSRIAADTEEEIKIKLSATHMQASHKNTVLTTRLIDGRFPDYTKVMPTDQTKRIEIAHEPLKKALNRVAILSNDKHRGVRFSIKENKLTLTSNNPEQEEAQEEIACKQEGEDIEIGFNIGYVQDILGAFPVKTLELGMATADSSCTVRSPEEGETSYVIMPMRL